MFDFFFKKILSFLLGMGLVLASFNSAAFGKKYIQLKNPRTYEYNNRAELISITIDPDHGHDEDVDRQPSALQGLSNRIKSVDGFDEAATLLGQLLPDLAGSLAAGSILTLATPLVWLGVTGMKQEYKEARLEFIHIAQSRESIEARLKAIAASSQKWQKVLNDKYGFQYKEDLAKDPKTFSKEELAATLVEHQAIRNAAFVNSLGARYGWTGMAGMGGMMSGMIMGLSSAVAEVTLDMGVGGAALDATAGALEVSAGSFFMPAQILMSGYALNRKRQGKRALKILDQASHTFAGDKGNGLSPATSEHVLSLITKQKKFIKKHSVKYGNRTAVGQSFMLAGTALGLSGMGLLITAPAYLIGAPLTIGTAISRIVNSEKEKRFKGSQNNFVNTKLEFLDPLSLLTICESNFICANKALEKEFGETRKRLTMAKVLSLLNHVVNDSGMIKKSPEAKLKKLQKRLQEDLYQLKGSELEREVIAEVRNYFIDHERELKSLVKSKARRVNRKLLKSMLLVLDGDFPAAHKVLFSHAHTDLTAKDLQTLESLGYKSESTDKSDMKSKKDKKKEKKSVSSLKKLTAQAIKIGKLSLKAIRFGLANSMVGLSQIKQTVEEIQAN